ncbi:MAG: 2-hydroxyacid dehydrogenase [Pseudomonadota bacterium]|uniref:2-hydroxyacid dehydrogenase n=1 Tax=Phenylobacterium sp. TaxID=1871053 RepID=UPI0025DE7E5A|nr:2-hydroxyacid dehydrogenase [Phenylobacterium sp.]MBT9471426.1 2-hydroxyacid dehydrogenase [Phenylobacterium sp.]
MISSPKPVVLLSNQMLSPMQQALEAQGYEVARRWELTPQQAAEVRAIVHAGEIPLPAEFLEGLPKLGLIACVSVGYDGVDVPWCRALGLEVTHAQGLNAEDVADHAIGLMIAGWRNLTAGEAMVRSGGWQKGERMGPRPSLRGRKLGVMGLGAIGEAVAVRAEAFGMEVAWWGPREKPGVGRPRAESLLKLAADSDVLVVACRADETNRKMVDQAVIEAVGARGMIVNVARGSIIDEDALIAALKDGRLGRAGLDVFETEPTPAERWADVPNAVLTPHSAGGTSDSVVRMVAQALENVRLFLSGEPVMSPVAA